MKSIVVVILTTVVLCYATTTEPPSSTTTPGPTHEPAERQIIHFVYNSRTHHLIMVRRHHSLVDCYVGTLTDSEIADVHTDSSLRQLELSLLARISLGQPVNEQDLARSDARQCLVANSTINYYNIT